ncbi:MAG TPA: hypothetical protein VLG10_07230 [Methylomirabilota bacterium]|nr:hypothetical protein [Methylomirabilota bacterium]
MNTPEMKQFGDLVPSDFERHPVWIGCHTADYDEPWYDETDEETFRPWNGPLPAGPSEGMLLVRAAVQLADGTAVPGFVTPALDEDDLGTQQPQIFVGGRRFGFWGGVVGVPSQDRQAFYAALGKPPEAVFPLRFAAEPGLTTGVVTGEVVGFYRLEGDEVEVEV